MEFDKIKKIRRRCISHANKLIKASKLLLEKKYSNIAYHLTTLALEEIGKSVMLVVGHTFMSSQKGVKILKQAGEDHSKKIFWALWGPTFGEKEMSKEQIESFIDLSKTIHFTRLRGLYVDPYQDSIDPGRAVPIGETRKLISLTETRIKMEEHREIGEPSDEVKSDFIWLDNAVEDSEKKKLILGKKSVDKLKEFGGNAAKWVSWMREQFNKTEKESQEFLRQELNRQEPSRQEKTKKKWQIKFRLYTPSHSIRQRILTDWNSKIEPIKLKMGKKTSKTSEMIIDMLLPRGVPLKALWYVAWGQTRVFAVSLSIATRGYFWWYLPKDVSKFYEKIIDLETNVQVIVERRPILTLDWGNNILSNRDLIHTAMCYRFLPRENVKFLNSYVTGISLMGKNDIHTPFEEEIFLQFFHALLLAMRFYKDYNEKDSLKDAVEKTFEPFMKNSFSIKEYIQMAEDLEKAKKAKKKITLSECGIMKILFDTYVLHKIIEIAKRAQKREVNRKKHNSLQES